jgi:YYY domain-containing protein
VLHISLWFVLKRWVCEYAYPLSYPVSLLLFGIISWWFGIFHLPIWISAFPFLLALGFIIGTGSVRFDEIRRELVWDLIFLGFFCAMLITRIKSSAIFAHESFLDMGIIASVMRNPVVPPLDPHFSGGYLDLYYYFSHWIFGALGITTQIPSTIVYNLILPTVLGLAAVSCYAIGRLIFPRFPSLLLLILVIPRPSFFAGLLSGGTIGFIDILEKSVQIIPGTGNNYPYYDLLWGLPHPHINALFIQVLLIFLILLIFLKWDELGFTGRRVILVLMGLTAGFLFLVNSWDAFFFYPLLLVITIILLFRIVSPSSGSSGFCHIYDPNFQSILLMGIAASVIIIPYAVQMHTRALSGIGVVQASSDLIPFLLVHGWYLIIFYLYLLGDIRKKPYFLCLGLVPAIFGYFGVAVMLIPFVYLVLKKDHNIYDYLAGYSIFIIIFTELFYLQEMVDPLSRYNTVFKFGAAAWPVIWVSAFGMVSFAVSDRFSHLASLRQKSIAGFGLSVFICLMLILAPVEPYFPVITLDGAEYLEVYQPDDSQIIEILNADNTATGIVEAAGDYDYHARIASFTGIPAIIGWPSVQMQWGRNEEEISRRVSDVERVYRDPSVTREVMDRYTSSHLVVGKLELLKYQNISINSYGLEPQYMGDSSKLIRKMNVVR